MTDRELLERAAKAAGYPQGRSSTLGGLLTANDLYWNPLTDDGDALRLAVKLQIDIVHFTGHLRTDVAGMPDVHQMHEGDPCAATRRAIVRAAAAMAGE